MMARLMLRRAANEMPGKLRRCLILDRAALGVQIAHGGIGHHDLIAQ